ncbi:MAG TPA: hypothetical protein VGS00_00855 [Thermoanaerobaculia bacterium]|nr:hypothetical protein [Thermoanaerobaculia bacterium]
MKKWTLGAAFCLAASSLWAARPTPAPTPTPTPRPRLGGGFGRAVSTPVPAGPGGQSLADVVRAAGTTKVREPGEKKAGVTIDNSSLVTDPTKGRLTTSQSAGRSQAIPPTPAASRTQAGPALTPSPATSSTSAAEEQKWREASRAAKKRVDDAKQRIEDLDAAAHKLEGDFYAWDDGQYRDRVIKPAWDKTKADLETARKDLAEAEKNLADLPERARKAGALPGWLRE